MSETPVELLRGSVVFTETSVFYPVLSYKHPQLQDSEYLRLSSPCLGQILVEPSRQGAAPTMTWLLQVVDALTLGGIRKPRSTDAFEVAQVLQWGRLATTLPTEKRLTIGFAGWALSGKRRFVQVEYPGANEDARFLFRGLPPNTLALSVIAVVTLCLREVQERDRTLLYGVLARFLDDAAHHILETGKTVSGDLCQIADKAYFETIASPFALGRGDEEAATASLEDLPPAGRFAARWMAKSLHEHPEFLSDDQLFHGLVYMAALRGVAADLGKTKITDHIDSFRRADLERKYGYLAKRLLAKHQDTIINAAAGLS